MGSEAQPQIRPTEVNPKGITPAEGVMNSVIIKAALQDSNANPQEKSTPLLPSGEIPDPLHAYKSDADFALRVINGIPQVEEYTVTKKGMFSLGKKTEYTKKRKISIDLEERTEMVMGKLPNIDIQVESKELAEDFLMRVLSTVELSKESIFGTSGEITYSGTIKIVAGVGDFVQQNADLYGSSNIENLIELNEILEKYRNRILSQEGAGDMPLELAHFILETSLALRLTLQVIENRPDIDIDSLTGEVNDLREETKEFPAIDIEKIRLLAEEGHLKLGGYNLLPTGKQNNHVLENAGLDTNVLILHELANINPNGGKLSPVQQTEVREYIKKLKVDPETALLEVRDMAQREVDRIYRLEQDAIERGELKSEEATFQKIEFIDDRERQYLQSVRKSFVGKDVRTLTKEEERRLLLIANGSRLVLTIAGVFIGALGGIQALQSMEQDNLLPSVDIDLDELWNVYREATSGYDSFSDDEGSHAHSAVPVLESLVEEIEGQRTVVPPSVDSIRDILGHRLGEKSEPHPAQSLNGDHLVSTQESEHIDVSSWGVQRASNDGTQKMHYVDTEGTTLVSSLESTHNPQVSQHETALHTDPDGVVDIDVETIDTSIEGDVSGNHTEVRVEDTTTHIAQPGDRVTEEQIQDFLDTGETYFEIEYGKTPSHAFIAAGLSNTEIFGEDGESGIWGQLTDGQGPPIAIHEGQAIVMVYDDPTTEDHHYRVINPNSSVDGTPANSKVLFIDLPDETSIMDINEISNLVERVVGQTLQDNEEDDTLTMGYIVNEIENNLGHHFQELNRQTTETISNVIEQSNYGEIQSLNIDNEQRIPREDLTYDLLYTALTGEEVPLGVNVENLFQTLVNDDVHTVVKHTNEGGSGLFVTAYDSDSDGVIDSYRFVAFENEQQADELYNSNFRLAQDFPSPTETDFYKFLQKQKGTTDFTEEVPEGFFEVVNDAVGNVVVKHINPDDGSGFFVQATGPDIDGNHTFEQFPFASESDANTVLEDNNLSPNSYIQEDSTNIGGEVEITPSIDNLRVINLENIEDLDNVNTQADELLLKNGVVLRTAEISDKNGNIRTQYVIEVNANENGIVTGTIPRAPFAFEINESEVPETQEDLLNLVNEKIESGEVTVFGQTSFSEIGQEVIKSNLINDGVAVATPEDGKFILMVAVDVDDNIITGEIPEDATILKLDISGIPSEQRDEITELYGIAEEKLGVNPPVPRTQNEDTINNVYAPVIFNQTGEDIEEAEATVVPDPKVQVTPTSVSPIETAILDFWESINSFDNPKIVDTYGPTIGANLTGNQKWIFTETGFAFLDIDGDADPDYLISVAQDGGMFTSTIKVTDINPDQSKVVIENIEDLPADLQEFLEESVIGKTQEELPPPLTVQPGVTSTSTSTPESLATPNVGATPQPTVVPISEIDPIFTQVDPKAISVELNEKNVGTGVGLQEITVNGTQISNLGFDGPVDINNMIKFVTGAMTIGMSLEPIDWLPKEIFVSVGEYYREMIMQRSSVATTPPSYTSEEGFGFPVIAFIPAFGEDVGKDETLEVEVQNIFWEEVAQLVVGNFTLSFLQTGSENYEFGNIRDALNGIGIDSIHDRDIPDSFRTGQLAPWLELLQHSVLEGSSSGLTANKEWDGLSDSGYQILVPNSNGEVVEYSTALEALHALNRLIMDIIGPEAVEEIVIPQGNVSTHLNDVNMITQVYTDPNLLNQIQGALKEKGFNIFRLIGIQGTDSEDRLQVGISEDVVQAIQGTVQFPYDLRFDELLGELGEKDKSPTNYISINQEDLYKLQSHLVDNVIATDRGKFIPVREVIDPDTGLPGFVFDSEDPTHLAPVNQGRGVTPEQIINGEVSSYEVYMIANSDRATFIRAIPVDEKGLVMDQEKINKVLQDGKIDIKEIFELVYPPEQKDNWPEGLSELSQAWGDIIEIENRNNSQNIQFLRIRTVGPDGTQNNTFLTVHTSATDNVPFLVEGKIYGATPENTAFLVITIPEDEIPEDRTELANLLSEKFDMEVDKREKNLSTPAEGDGSVTSAVVPDIEPSETALPESPIPTATPTSTSSTTIIGQPTSIVPSAEANIPSGKATSVPTEKPVITPEVFPTPSPMATEGVKPTEEVAKISGVQMKQEDEPTGDDLPKMMEFTKKVDQFAKKIPSQHTGD